MNTNTFTTEQLADTIANMSANYTERKINADDIFNSAERSIVAEVASALVTNYTGTFQYMVNMKSYLRYGLTDAQIAGVLNSAIADYRYNQKKAAVQQAEAVVASTQYDHSTQVVVDGYYTVQGNTSHRTIRLTTIKDKSDGVKQWLSYLNGPDNTGDYTSIGTVHGNEVKLFRKNEGKYTDIVAATRYVIKNINRLGEFGKNYATRSGNCYRCNRLLTTPESVALGLGPICAAK